MKNLNAAFWLIIVSFFFLQACKPFFYITEEKTETYLIDNNVEEDSLIKSLIAPYKEKLDNQMQRIIGHATNEMLKEQPECGLGNFMADAITKKSADYLGKKVDFGVVNYGGVRLPSIGEGDLTVGQMFELMPFDNMLIALELDGATTKRLIEHIGLNGGWPVSAACRFVYDKEGKLKSAHIGEEAFDINRSYTVALSDYIANGGDKCTFLKGIKQMESNVLFRYALIEYVEELTKNQTHLTTQIEGRIIYE